MDREKQTKTNGQKDRQIKRQTDKYIWTNGQIDRQAD